MLKRTMFLMTLISTFLYSNLIFAQEPVGAPVQSLGPLVQSDEYAPSMGFVELSLGYGMCNGDYCDDIDGSVGFSLAGFYNINQNIAVGGNFTYQMLSPDAIGVSFSAMSFSGEGRFYFPINPQIKVYGLGALGYVQGEFEYGGQSMTNDNSGVFFKVGGGVAYSITPQITVGFQLYYQNNQWSEVDPVGETPDLNFIFMGLSVTFSF